jgi:hypothetical protein
MRFPTVSGLNLSRETVSLPEGLEGELNVLVIAFQRWQQGLIESWVPLLEQLERTIPGARYYELPTLQRLDPISRTFINEGMRAGIADSHARERTITLYLDKSNFRSALGLPDEDTIYVLLVDRQGQVLWRAEGALTRQKGDSLVTAVQQSGQVQRD